MRVNLSLTRDEFVGMVTVMSSGLHALPAVNLYEVLRMDAMWSLQAKLASRLPGLKARGNRITLSGMECMAVWDVMNALVDMLQPFEMTLAYRLLAEIDSQKEASRHRWRYDAGETHTKFLG